MSTRNLHLLTNTTFIQAPKHEEGGYGVDLKLLISSQMEAIIVSI
jgi:hypothetical protein